MKRFFLFTLALLAFVACTHNDVEELAANRADVPETLTVGFETSDTRIQLDEAQKTVWNAGDLVSVFYRSDANQKWQFQGETGDREGNLKRLESAMGTTNTTKTVVVYPYSEDYWLNTDSYFIDAYLPAVQHYAEGSYGIGDNLMVAQSEFTQFSLKNVCGWLKVQLTGNGEKVTRLILKGNNNEQLAGLIYVDTATAEATLATEMGSSDDNNAGGNLIFDDAIVTELTLDCGEGVVLGAEATAFYIAVPPQTFEGGFTVDVECKDYEPMTISTENSVTIQRNTIQPMATIELDADAINDTIYYTATAKINKSWDFNTFGANILSHEWNSKTGEGIITFDTDVTTIGKYAFEDCLNLTGITIPDSVTTIGEGAFYLCRYLTGITIPNSVTTIGKMAFTSCSSLTNITIPDSVTTIENQTFYDCESLINITIPDSVTSIGFRTFYGCSDLTSISIPDSVTTIGNEAFASCQSLTEFNGELASEDGRCLIIDGTLSAFAPTGLTSYTIPDSVTTIGEAAFCDCYSLTSVTIPDSVTMIGERAFYFCNSLTNVTIGDSVTTIGSGAFAYCDSLTSVTIGDSVTTIGDGAFGGCSSLTSITIPDSVTTIGVSAFGGCSNLTSITIPDSVSTIGDDAFNDCYSLTSVAIGDSITTIGEGAFESCSSLTSIIIPDSVTMIGERAFCFCNSLTSVTIGDSVTTIGGYAFYKCYSLTSITIPDSVTTIGNMAFAYCDSLISVTIPNSVTTIGQEAFCGCDGLTSITIGDRVTKIGDYAFWYCESLTSVYCKATTPPSLGGSYVFDDNASGRKIYVPAASVGAYKSSAGWSEYADAIVGYDFENGEFAQDTTKYTFATAHLGHSSAGGIQVIFSDANDSYRLFATFFTEEKYIPTGIYYAGYSGLLSPESYMYANGENHAFNQESNSTENSIVVELAADDTYTFTFNNLLFGKEYVATGSWSGKIEGLGANVKEDEFQATHVATQWMWGGYSQSSWGNYYIVSGEGFSMQVHFCTDVATETTLATGDYKWAGITMISNSTPERFSTKAIKINGADVYAANGEMSVTEKNGVYTIKLSIVNRDTNETYGILFNGKLNEAGSEVK